MYGVDHSETMKALAARSGLYRDQGKYDQAELLFQEQKEVPGGVGFSTDEHTARALDVLASCRLARKKYREAEAVLRRSVEIWKAVDPEGWRLGNAMSLLGDSLLGQKKYAEAEPFLAAGYEGMRGREARLPVTDELRPDRGPGAAVKLSDAQGQKDKAEWWRREVAAAKSRLAKPSKK